MVKMMMIAMMTMVNPPDDKVKLSKVKANIVNTKHLVFRAQLNKSVVIVRDKTDHAVIITQIAVDDDLLA